MVIEPLLIDEDYYARVEGREIISNLAKVSASLVEILIYIFFCLQSIKNTEYHDNIEKRIYVTKTDLNHNTNRNREAYRDFPEHMNL